MIVKFIGLSIFAYLLGSIPFGYIVGRLNKVDVLTLGSKSASSTNVSRALGWRWALVSALLDFSKGALPAYLGRLFLTNEWFVIIVALLPMLGQVFPIFLKFRGGKGASSFYGATLGLIGARYFVYFFPAALLIFALTKKTSLTNMIFSWLLFILIVIFSAFLHIFPTSYIFFAGAGATFLLVALRENLKRLSEGKEPDTPLKW
ncbi:MAG: glycerol-3-phosphate acyltransferase [Caldisericaceae bacterium]